MSNNLSLIIVSFYSRGMLSNLLVAIGTQEVELCEVIVVNNTPDDDLMSWLNEHYPWVRLVDSPVNGGYAGGNNLGFEVARGEWVCVLNPDTIPQPGAIAELLAVARANPDALINPKLLNPDGTINACGTEMHLTGIVTCRGLNRDAADYRGVMVVPLLSGAAFIARRDVLQTLGGFNDDYFMYFEDTDLSLRARLAGYRLLCAADAEVVHDYDLKMSPQKFYYLERNRLLTLFRNYEARTLWQLAPALLLTEMATWAFAVLKGPRYMLARWRGYKWLWRQRHNWRRARHTIQDTRQIGDDTLLADSLTTLPYDQLVANERLATWLTRLTAPLYRLLRPRLGHAPAAKQTS